MEAVSWPTVAVSTVVSAVVSVLVAATADYFARPGLEARTERIMERHRARRTFGTELARVQVAATTMTFVAPDDLDPEVRAKLANEIARQREAVLAACDVMDDALLSFLMTMPLRLRDAVSTYVGSARGLATSHKPDAEAGRELHTITTPVLEYFHARGWRRVLKRNYVRRARKALELGDGDS